MSGFFGNLFKEMRVFGSQATEEINPLVPSPIEANPVENNHQNIDNHQNIEHSSKIDQEEYELQLALALSISHEHGQDDAAVSPTTLEAIDHLEKTQRDKDRKGKERLDSISAQEMELLEKLKIEEESGTNLMD